MIKVFRNIKRSDEQNNPDTHGTDGLAAITVSENAEAAPPVYWNIWQAVLCFAAVFVITNFAAVLFYGSSLDVQYITIILTLLQNALTIALPFIIVIGVYHYDLSYLGFSRIGSGKLVLEAILRGLLYYLLAGLLLFFIIMVYPFEVGVQDSLIPLLDADNNFVLIVWVCFACILAPFAEEVFFRGFLYAALRNKLSVYPAALIAGLLFGAVHLDLMRLLPIALLGFLLCLFYEKHRNIWLNAIMHMSFNSFALILLFYNKII